MTTRLPLGAGLLAAAAFALSLQAGPAQAREVSRDELEQLIDRAASDDTALAELRRVDAVDGEPMPVGAALEGADQQELTQRLDAFSSDDLPAGPADAARLRSEAREIVSNEEYQPPRLPDPVRRVFEWIGDKLQPLGRWFDRLASHLPGRRATLWLIIAVAVVAIAAVIAGRVAARRAPAASRSGVGRSEAQSNDLTRLEREAEEAERSGDLEAAIRLRFRAGLLRLDEADLIEFRPSMTSREIASSLRSRTFEDLARMFDEVVYGRRRPELSDAVAARDAWNAVVREAVAA